MKCAACRERLTDLVDDRLLDAERGEIAAHLEACAACRAEASGLRSLRAALRTIGPAKAPFGALDAARSALREEMSSHPESVAAAAPPSFWARLGPYRIAATLVAGVLTGLILYRDVIDPRRRAESTAVVADRRDDASRSGEYRDEAAKREIERIEDRLETIDAEKAPVIAIPVPGDEAAALRKLSESKSFEADADAANDRKKQVDAEASDDATEVTAARRVAAPEKKGAPKEKEKKDAGAKDGFERLKSDIVEELARDAEPSSRNPAAFGAPPAAKAADLERAAAAAAGWLGANASNVLGKNEGGEGLASGESFQAALDDFSGANGAVAAPSGRRDAAAAPGGGRGAPLKKAPTSRPGAAASEVPESYAYLLPSGADAARLAQELGALGWKSESAEVPVVGKSKSTSRTVTVEADPEKKDEILAIVTTSAGSRPHLLAKLGKPQRGAKAAGAAGTPPPEAGAEMVEERSDAAEGQKTVVDETKRTEGGATGSLSGGAPTTRPTTATKPRSGRLADDAPSASRPAVGRKIRLHFIVP